MNEKDKTVDPLDYVLDGGWLLERQHAKRIQVRGRCSGRARR
jgi:hypothetical protein